MEIKIIKNSIMLNELKNLARDGFGDMIKAVVDIRQGIMAVGGGLHADEEVLLVEEEGSKREDTWGINLYPDKTGEDFIEFDSMINIKPAFGNRARNVKNPETRKRIAEIAHMLIQQ
jgi:hypothetical protein